MQDQIIASHTSFGGHMDVDYLGSLQTLNVSDDLKWTTNTHMTPFTLTFEAQLTISMILEDLFLLLNFLPVQPYFYPSTMVFTHPNDGCMYSLWDVIRVHHYSDSSFFFDFCNQHSYRLSPLKISIYTQCFHHMFCVHFFLQFRFIFGGSFLIRVLKTGC